jgi:hypothetical protein
MAVIGITIFAYVGTVLCLSLVSLFGLLTGHRRCARFGGWALVAIPLFVSVLATSLMAPWFFDAATPPTAGQLGHGLVESLGLLLWIAPPVLLGILTLRVSKNSRIRPLKYPVCQKCGYNLRGNNSGICPECGTEIRAPEDREAIRASRDLHAVKAFMCVIVAPFTLWGSGLLDLRVDSPVIFVLLIAISAVGSHSYWRLWSKH